MPSTYEILAATARIANRGFAFAMVWHAVILACGVAVLLGVRPPARSRGLLLCLPLLSVSAFAAVFGNPFNASVFLLLALALAAAAWRARDELASRATQWARALGAALLLFAWIYPHFLVERSPLAYAYGAPLGLIPCPTLSFVIGVTLLGYGPGVRAWSLALGTAGVFYGALGTFKLGVTIDGLLLAGALAVLVNAFAHEPRPRVARAHSG